MTNRVRHSKMPTHSGRGGEVDPIGDEAGPRFPDDDQFRVPAERDERGRARYPVTDLQRRDAFPHSLDDSGRVHAQYQRQRYVHAGGARNELHVQRRVDRNGVYPNEHFTRPRSGILDFLQV